MLHILYNRVSGVLDALRIILLFAGVAQPLAEVRALETLWVQEIRRPMVVVAQGGLPTSRNPTQSAAMEGRRLCFHFTAI